MLEVRPSGSKWAPIDRREHGDPVAGVHHRFSVGVERAGGVGWSTAELSGHLLKYPELFFVALTFPESKRHIYLTTTSAGTVASRCGLCVA